MLITCVVDDEIHDNLHAALVRTVKHLFKSIHSTELFSDIVVVRDVVSAVSPGGGIKRGEPDPVHPEAFEIIKLFVNAVEVSHPVSVPVFKAAGPDLIKYAVFIPSCTFHDDASVKCSSVMERFSMNLLFIIPLLWYNKNPEI